MNIDFEKGTLLYGEGYDKEALKLRLSSLEETFISRFGSPSSDIFSSPGRIEICGNHTDHQNGEVLVGAIDCDMLAVTKKADGVVTVLSEGFPEFSFHISDLSLKEAEKGTSLAMAKGVLKGFVDEGYLVGGFSLAMNSTIFKGAGVSSSAAFELLIAQILNFYYNENNAELFSLAKIGQFAENVYFGKPCGLLDQTGIAFGGICHVDFENTKKPLIKKVGDDLKGLDVVIINTGDHTNLTSEYADIRADLKSVCDFFSKTVLREVDEKDFWANLKGLKEKVSGRAILRAVHIFNENKRVRLAEKALENNDSAGFLKAISESGRSSSMLLQNTMVEGDRVQAIPLAVEIAKENLFFGTARVHGGGFAGTIICFVDKTESAQFANKMKDIFGTANVFEAKVRALGTTRL